MIRAAFAQTKERERESARESESEHEKAGTRAKERAYTREIALKRESRCLWICYLQMIIIGNSRYTHSGIWQFDLPKSTAKSLQTNQVNLFQIGTRSADKACNHEHAPPNTNTAQCMHSRGSPVVRWLYPPLDLGFHPCKDYMYIFVHIYVYVHNQIYIYTTIYG